MRSKKQYVVYGSEYACDGVYTPVEISKTFSKNEAYKIAEDTMMFQDDVYKETWVQKLGGEEVLWFIV